MSKHHTYAGEATHHHTDGSIHRFTPAKNSRLKTYHEAVRENPTTRLSSGGLSARLFVGLNVGQKRGYTVDDVVEIVWKVRKKQKRSGDASILAQKGIYEDRSGKRVTEPSVQIIIIDFSGAAKDVFTSEMEGLAETLCKQMKQETVILEIQKRGVVEDVYSVTA
jgi:hypothetical protein